MTKTQTRVVNVILIPSMLIMFLGIGLLENNTTGIVIKVTAVPAVFLWVVTAWTAATDYVKGR